MILLLAKDAQSGAPIIRCAITESPIVDWKICSYIYMLLMFLRSFLSDAFCTEQNLGQVCDNKYWTTYEKILDELSQPSVRFGKATYTGGEVGLLPFAKKLRSFSIC